MLRTVLVLAAAAFAIRGQQVSIEMQDGGFAVRGWTAPATPPAGGWPSVLQVFAGSGDVPPLLGEHAVQAGVLIFRPKYPLSPGVKARAVFRVKGAAPVEAMFHIPARTIARSARVLQIYPSSASIPENQLRLYIEFSAPMSHGEAWKHIRLLKENGEAVELPFLEIDQELWDAESKRLTVLFDPGRIKRGVLPLEDIGPAIESGHRYTIAIDAAWSDAAGAPLVTPFRRMFRVVEADRTPIDPATWKIPPVKRGTTDPLVIRFPEPLDQALAQRLIWIEGVQGRVELAAEEREWRFTPHSAWNSGPYVLRVDTALEDLAGNRVGRAFDVDTFDTFQRVSRRIDREVLSVPLHVKP